MINYTVIDNGKFGPISKLSYSKFNDRFAEFQKGNLKEEDVYGYQQAIEHIKELQSNPKYSSSTFKIKKETITTEIIEL